MLQAINKVFIPGPSGLLETCVKEPSKSSAKGVMIVLHPNPLHGGTNQNKVVQTVLKAAVNCGHIVYAPNLRGVGLSGGVHDFGRGEVDDVAALVQYIQEKHLALPILLAGFSFGGFVAIKSVQRFNFKKVVLIGAAVDQYADPAPHLPAKTSCLLIHGENDEIISLDSLFSWARVQDLPVSIILDASHFFHGKLIPLQHLIEEFLN